MSLCVCVELSHEAENARVYSFVLVVVTMDETPCKDRMQLSNCHHCAYNYFYLWLIYLIKHAEACWSGCDWSCTRRITGDQKHLPWFWGNRSFVANGFLPPYDQLKVLEGSSGLATLVSAVQSMGYIYGVVVRTIQGLPVSRTEGVALMWIILILMLHNIVSTCHRPLHVYLTDEQAHTFVDKCEEYTTLKFPKSYIMVPFVVIVLLISSVGLYYIIHMWRTSR